VVADELPYIGAVEALQRFRARTLSPVELLDAMYARADEVEPTINALTTRRTEQAYAAARESTQRWAGTGGEPRALEGLPVAAKEEQPLIGESIQFGSLLFADEIAPVTHPVCERVLDAGGVIHARTTTPEFSCAGFTQSKLWGITRNPWNPLMSPGGSSGGSGASLASGTSVLATGSDIGGSIRIPASVNGLVGFKPPYGRVPALPPFNLDAYCHDGPMGRSVADVALLQNVIAGQHPVDHVSLRNPPTLPLEYGSITGRRIAFAVTVGDMPLDDDVETNTRAFADVLRSAGAIVDEVTIDIPRSLWMTAAMIHFGAIFGESVGHDAGEAAALLTAYAADFATRSTSILAEHTFYEGLELESNIHQAIAAAMGDADALVLPCVASSGWLADDDYVDTKLVVGGVELDDYFESMFTPLFNIASRHPVLSVPSGRAANGVPTGVQIVGHTFDDLTTFEIGAAVEREMGGWWADPSWRPA
jgi:aspartyl-tRNA(Asn)/glutamyl-tRNA(Gln) amidotransferase subunit A